jgi:hypothetical protein
VLVALGENRLQQQQSGYVQNSQQPRMIGLQDIENFVRNNPQAATQFISNIVVSDITALGKLQQVIWN